MKVWKPQSEQRNGDTKIDEQADRSVGKRGEYEDGAKLHVDSLVYVYGTHSLVAHSHNSEHGPHETNYRIYRVRTTNT